MTFSSCGGGSANVKKERLARTGMDTQETVVILLARFTDGNERNDLLEREQEIRDCMKQAMLSSTGRVIQTIPGIDFRRTLFPRMKPENAPRSTEALLDLLQDDKERNRILDMSIRYIVIVDVQTDSSQGTGKSLWGSTKTSRFHATVLDAKNRIKSGEVYSDSSGTVGSSLPMLSRTERDACSGLGKAVGEFVASDEEPGKAQ